MYYRKCENFNKFLNTKIKFPRIEKRFDSVIYRALVPPKHTPKEDFLILFICVTFLFPPEPTSAKETDSVLEINLACLKHLLTVIVKKKKKPFQEKKKKQNIWCTFLFFAKYISIQEYFFLVNSIHLVVAIAETYSCKK